jgi:hypothetical protein
MSDLMRITVYTSPKNQLSECLLVRWIAHNGLDVLLSNVGNNDLKDFSDSIKMHFAHSPHFDLGDSLKLLPLLMLTEKEKLVLINRVRDERLIATFFYDSSSIDSLIHLFDTTTNFQLKREIASTLGRIGAPTAAVALLRGLSSEVTDTVENRITSIRLPIIKALGMIEPTNELLNKRICMIENNHDWGYVHIDAKPRLNLTTKEQYTKTFKMRWDYSYKKFQPFNEQTATAIGLYLDSIGAWGRVKYGVNLKATFFKPFIIIAKKEYREMPITIRKSLEDRNAKWSNFGCIERWRVEHGDQEIPDTIEFFRNTPTYSPRVRVIWQLQNDSSHSYCIPLNSLTTMHDSTLIITTKRVVICRNQESADDEISEQAIDANFLLKGIFKKGIASGTWTLESEQLNPKKMNGTFQGLLFPEDSICVTSK